MRRWLRPHSRSFRAVLGMALLAWTALATGALAGPLQMSEAMDMTAMPATASQAPAKHCDGMPMQPDNAKHAPASPLGHGDCCHGGCHCLSVCNAVLGVPRLIVAVSLPHARVPIIAPGSAAQRSSAPPLRPPIV